MDTNTSSALKPGNGWALLPLGVFLLVYVLSSVMLGDFYKVPVSVAFLAAAAVAIAMDRHKPLSGRIADFARGMGHLDIMMMCLIFMLAGIFAEVCRHIGAIDATVNMGLSLLPDHLLLVGLFLIACFISISIGTSVGTVAALAPVALSLAAKLDASVGLMLGALVGGAMFGDNLSMISDTTIAATRTQGSRMGDKFRENFLIVLPAALATMGIYAFMPQQGAEAAAQAYDWVLILPYVSVLVGAILGANVFALLLLGSLLAAALGVWHVGLQPLDLLGAAAKGMQGMSELVMVSMLVGGVVELVRQLGGIDFLLYQVTRMIRGRRGAEVGIGVLVSLVDACTANNTIAIIITGPIVRDIAERHGISPKRAASLLDTFSCFMQGMIPYGAQLLTAVALAGGLVGPLQVMEYLFYPYLMGISALVFIFLRSK